jgi:hypothetical protein
MVYQATVSGIFILSGVLILRFLIRDGIRYHFQLKRTFWKGVMNHGRLENAHAEQVEE